MKKLAILLFVFSAGVTAQEKPLQATELLMQNITYPFPVKEFMLNIQGQSLKMAYMDVQPAKPNGKTVVLLHGKNFYAGYWEQTANDLSAAGYRVVMPDQIGFGKSSKPANIQYSFQLLAQNTKALLDELKITKTAVLGHSMGGMLATRFALMYPDITQKLILENPIGLEDWRIDVPYQSVDQWYTAEAKQDFQKMKEYQMKSYYDNKWKPEYEKWMLPVAGWTKNKDYIIIAKNAALTYDMIFTQPVCYEFQELKVPVLLIIGQRDRTALGKDRAPKEAQERLGNYPALGRKAKLKMISAPYVELTELNDVGHLPHIEAYEKFIGPLKDFLSK